MLCKLTLLQVIIAHNRGSHVSTNIGTNHDIFQSKAGFRNPPLSDLVIKTAVYRKQQTIGNPGQTACPSYLVDE